MKHTISIIALAFFATSCCCSTDVLDKAVEMSTLQQVAGHVGCPPEEMTLRSKSLTTATVECKGKVYICSSEQAEIGTVRWVCSEAQ